MSLVKPLRIQNKRFKYRDWTVLLPVTIFFTHRSLSRLKVKLRVHSFVCLFFPPFASAVCSLRYLLIWVASHLFIGFLMGCLGREGSSYFHYGYYWNWCELPRWLSGKESACQCRRGRLDSWIPGPGRSHRKRNSNPLQYSDLENPMGRGAWWATVHGVAKSQTRLSDFTFSVLCWIPKLGILWWALELSQQCKNFFGIIVLQFVGCLPSGSVVGLTYCTSQVCCSQRPCPCSRPLLIHASAGDTQTLKGRSDLVSCGVLGSWCTWGFASALQVSLVGVGFDFRCDFASPTIFVLLLCPWAWGVFFGGVQHSPIDGCSAVTCNFGFLTEDESTSFYSTIFLEVLFAFCCL